MRSFRNLSFRASFTYASLLLMLGFALQTRAQSPVPAVRLDAPAVERSALPPSASAATATAPSAVRIPRVLLQSVSKGGNRNSDRDQSSEMAKDFEKNCPMVKITINQAKADYTVTLNHIEYGLLVRDNQFEVYDADGDRMKGKEGGSINKGVKGVCALIAKDWESKVPTPAAGQ